MNNEGLRGARHLLGRVCRGVGAVWWAGLVLTSPWATAAAGAQPDVPPHEFAWRGTLALPQGASLVRVHVPVQALLQLQSSSAHDLRVFNAAGTVVPFAVLGRSELSQAAPSAQTKPYAAFPLFAASPDRPLRGAVQVQVDGADGQGSAWVRWDHAAARTSADAAAQQPLQAALLDMRSEEHTLDALNLTLELPRNALVPLALSSSSDLKAWTPVATKGPVFQFDGPDAPTNFTLAFHQPLKVKERYLRVSWAGQGGVKLVSATGRVAMVQTEPAPLRTALPTGTLDGNGLNWSLSFATPIVALHLQAPQDNTLLPVRILGRSDAAQPWRALASSVVYRLDTVGHGTHNPPTPLHGASVRALRVEPVQGQPLPTGGLQATVEFAPLQVAFLASGSGPFVLAAGRAQTPAATVDAGLLGSVSPAKLAELPAATVAAVQFRPKGALESGPPMGLVPGVPLRTVLLWLVLGIGVLALGGVAYALMRQLQSAKKTSAK